MTIRVGEGLPSAVAEPGLTVTDLAEEQGVGLLQGGDLVGGDVAGDANGEARFREGMAAGERGGPESEWPLAANRRVP